MKIKCLISIAFILLAGCGSEDSESFTDDVRTSSGKVLFVASGSCYAGGVTTSAGSNTITAFDLNTGKKLQILVDYTQVQPGDSPVGVDEYDDENLIVLVENASGRRIDLVRKDGKGISTFITNTTALSAVGRKILAAVDGSGFLVSKSSAIEKFSPSKARILQGANPYINAPAAPCATSTTLISDFVQLPNGKHVYIHAAASPNNKMAVISSAGYATAVDCLVSQAAPTTLALPTAVAYHPAGRLLVAYGSTTTASNFIYSYDINQTTNVISNVTSSYLNTGIVNGPSAMTVDSATGNVFVAVGNSGFNTIEKFAYNTTTRLLSRENGNAFITPTLETRCVTSMKVANR